MSIFGNYNHDFPRLAQQSGFYFQLHRGKVNWTDIEKINVDEIISKRNFQLLEQNLINVINCDLEREYDINTLDKNLVKLFQLAQLGVDYLSYCESYLDKCVILLQEQLIVFQEEYEFLKNENIKSKKKSKSENFQCEKCKKVFLSDVYLKYHDRRRHGSPSTPKSSDSPLRKYANNSQQTETAEKLSVFTQTVLSDETMKVSEKSEEAEIKKQHVAKMENLEQELKELKDRLKNAENALSQKTESSNVLQSSPVPGSMYYNSLLLLLPSYQTGFDNSEVKQKVEVSAPEQFDNKSENPVVETATEIKPKNENISQLSTELEEVLEKTPELSKDDSYPAEKELSVLKNYQEEIAEVNKENIDLSKEIDTELKRPLPPPRKSKKFTRKQPNDGVEAKPLTPPTRTNNPEFSSQYLSNFIPIKKRTVFESSSDITEELREDLNNLEDLKCDEILKHNHENQVHPQPSKSKSSPRLGKLRKNLRSLTNLRDIEPKKTDSSFQNIRAAVVEGLNNNLRHLGIDSEWSGIPKKTMIQKLNDLRHQRKALSKENSMYPVIRQNIEDSILKKLRNSLGKKKTKLMKKLSKRKSMSVEEILPEDKPEYTKPKTTEMYDTDTESESRAFGSENLIQEAEPRVLSEFLSRDTLESEKEEFNISVFQVRGQSPKKSAVNVKKEIPLKVLSTDSEDDDDFLENFENKSIKSELGYENARGERKEESDVECSSLKQNENLPKSNKEEQSKQKKGPFFTLTNNFDEELSDSPSDCDLWSLEGLEKKLGRTIVH